MPKYYTGVGSRETPEHILKLMKDVGYWLASQNYIGRSGSADGADSAFEDGYTQYINTHGKSIAFEAYLPWDGFNNKSASNTHIVTPKLHNYNDAVDIVSEIHPVWERLKRGARALHTRNVYQVLGRDLNTPSSILFCYAQPTFNRKGELTGVKGGTNTAVQIAMNNNIPIYNFYLEEDIEKVRKLMSLNKEIQ